MDPEQPHQHIRLSRRQVVDRLLAETTPPRDGRGLDGLRGVFELIQAVAHFQGHAVLEAMKAAYLPFNPDDDQAIVAASERELTRAAQDLASELARVLEAGSYHAVDPAVIDEAFRRQSLFRVNMSVDFSAFEELLVYARGRTVKPVEIPRRLGRRPRVIDVESFDRVCLYVRFKSADQLTDRQKKQIPYPPGSMLLKLFRNIPLADLEMLFPNCQVRLRLSDKLVLGVPALVGGVPVLLKLAPLLVGLGVLLGISRQQPGYGASTVAAFTGLIMLIVYLFQQWNKIKSRRVQFLKLLSENLYFHNLDNNEGVLTRLIDEAEEEGCKEVILVYALALTEGRPLTDDELSARASDWLSRETRLDGPFDATRAILRLAELGLVEPAGARWWAVPTATALVRLDAHWDRLFPHAEASRGAPAVLTRASEPPAA